MLKLHTLIHLYHRTLISIVHKMCHGVLGMLKYIWTNEDQITYLWRNQYHHMKCHQETYSQSAALPFCCSWWCTALRNHKEHQSSSGVHWQPWSQGWWHSCQKSYCTHLFGLVWCYMRLMSWPVSTQSCSTDCQHLHMCMSQYYWWSKSYYTRGRLGLLGHGKTQINNTILPLPGM